MSLRLTHINVTMPEMLHSALAGNIPQVCGKNSPDDTTAGYDQTDTS